MEIAKKLPKNRKQSWPRIKQISYPNGTTAWMIDARLKGTNGSRHHRQTRGEAETLAEQLRVQRINEGNSAFALEPADRADAQASLELLKPHGATLREATRFYLKHLDVIKKDILLSDFILEIISHKQADGMSSYTHVTYRLFLRMFTRDFPGFKMSDFTPPLLDEWLRSRGVSPVTRNGYRMRLITTFAYAKSLKYCLDNPAAKTIKVSAPTPPPGILSVNDCVRLLAACDEAFLPCILLGMFAGLRPFAEVLRLEWKHIDLESGLIDIEATRTKSAQQRYVTILPNLKEWLLPYLNKKGKVSPSITTYQHRLQLTRAKAGITDWPNDVLRHTFDSMHYAHFPDVGDTAKQMGHTGTDMLFKHYRARVKPAEAAAFWNIRPGRESNVVPLLATA